METGPEFSAILLAYIESCGSKSGLATGCHGAPCGCANGQFWQAQKILKVNEPLSFPPTPFLPNPVACSFFLHLHLIQLSLAKGSHPHKPLCLNHFFQITPQLPPFFVFLFSPLGLSSNILSSDKPSLYPVVLPSKHLSLWESYLKIFLQPLSYPGI